MTRLSERQKLENKMGRLICKLMFHEGERTEKEQVKRTLELYLDIWKRKIERGEL